MGGEHPQQQRKENLYVCGGALEEANGQYHLRGDVNHLPLYTLGNGEVMDGDHEFHYVLFSHREQAGAANHWYLSQMLVTPGRTTSKYQVRILYHNALYCSWPDCCLLTFHPLLLWERSTYTGQLQRAMTQQPSRTAFLVLLARISRRRGSRRGPAAAHGSHFSASN